VEELAMTNVQPLSEGESLAVGADGDHVQALQEMLQHLGYYQGQVDAQYGPVLEEAVKEFQRAIGHQEDGQTGVETWHELLHQMQQTVGGAEGAAEEVGIQVGQLSEDGAWQWNGTEWVAAAAQEAHEALDTAAIQVGQLSEDGAWQWDGTEWKAAGGAEQPAEAQSGGAEHPPQEDFHSAIVASINVQAGEEA
jgi:peptidoglycan hydrolase-like protein with peptidoglycan-binding domain